MSVQPVKPALTESRSLHQLTRQDLAASVNLFQKGARSARLVLPALAVPGGLLGGALLTMVASYFRLPEAVQPASFLLGWAIALGGFWVWSRRQRALLAECQLECGSCHEPMLVVKRGQLTSRAEIAAATGRCPACGDALFEGTT